MVLINRAAMDQQFQAWFIGPSSRFLGLDAWGPLIHLDDEWNNPCNLKDCRLFCSENSHKACHNS